MTINRCAGKALPSPIKRLAAGRADWGLHSSESMSRAVRRMTAATIVMALALTNVGWGDDPVFSGPQVGEPLAPLEVVGVYDRMSGQKWDLLVEADGKPALIVFVHSVTRPGMALTRALTDYANSLQEQGVYVAVVWLHEDRAKAEEFLTRARQSLNLQVPVGISVDGIEGPGTYGLNRNVELTILVVKENMVTANFALVQPSVTEAAKIAGELAKLAGTPPPTSEQLEKMAYPGAAMRMRERGAAEVTPDAAEKRESR